MSRALAKLVWRWLKRPRPTPDLRPLTKNERRIRGNRQAYYRRLKEIRNAGLRKELGNG